MEVLTEVRLPVPLLRRGKVRDVYDLGEDLLLAASDRLSAFDCVLPEPIPFKGAVLTQISCFWFRQTRSIVQNHLISGDPEEIARRHPELADSRAVWGGRSMLVRKATPFPVECVVRGYLAGSGWKEYRERGTLAGEPLPEGLVEADRLPEPLFTPATKAEEGHDVNITYGEMERRLGIKLAANLRENSLALFEAGSAYLERRDILLADTKFEFGAAETGEILLIDEALTPDSSRMWPRESYEPGGAQSSLDKQPVRDYLEGLFREDRWDKAPPAPNLPPEVVRATSERYREAYRRVTGEELTIY